MTARIPLSIEAELRKELPREVFQPKPSRLLWLFPHAALIWLGYALYPTFAARGLGALAAIPVALAFGGLMFVGHEVLHGAVVKNRKLMRLLGFITLGPLLLSPRLWMAWHNRTHHENTNVEEKDPDAYPSLAQYEASQLARYSLELAAPGMSRFRGLITLLFGFNFQSMHVLLGARRLLGVSRKQHTLMLFETLGLMAFWAGVAHQVGVGGFIWLWFFPVVFTNALVMSFIVTNHSLSKMGAHLDVLATSLTVRPPKLLDLYTLGFGYHVEHHLFPTMSHAHGPALAALLERRYPDRYQTMGWLRALSLVFRTPRVHTVDGQLLDPKTGRKIPTLPRLKHALAAL